SSSSASTGTWPAAMPVPPPPSPVGAGERWVDATAALDGRPRAGRRPDRLISSSVVDMCRYLRHAAQQRGSMVVPGVLAPKLQPIARPHDDDLLLQLRVLGEEARQHDP